MKIFKKSSFAGASLIALSTLVGSLQAATIVGSWGDAASQYNASTNVWTDSSGNGNNLTLTAGTNGSSVVTNTASAGLFTGTSLTGVKFGASTLLEAGTGVADRSNFTIISLVSYGATGGDARLYGVGALSEGDVAPVLNPAQDGSIRRNNGFNGGTTSTANYFIRATTLSGDGVANAVISDFYYTSENLGALVRTTNINAANFGSVATTVDTFYMGQVSSALNANAAVVNTLLFDGALTTNEIDGYAQQLFNNPNVAVVPEPSSSVMILAGVTLLALRRRRMA